MKADPISGDMEAARLRDKVHALQKALPAERAREIAAQLENDGSDEMAEDLEAYAEMAQGEA